MGDTNADSPVIPTCRFSIVAYFGTRFYGEASTGLACTEESLAAPVGLSERMHDVRADVARTCGYQGLLATHVSPPLLVRG